MARKQQKKKQIAAFPTPLSQDVLGKPANPEISWHQAVDIVCEHIVRISAPQGQGTGFLVSVGPEQVAIATAAHVIDEAHYWEQPIRIDHPFSKGSVLLRHTGRAIWLDGNRDTAAILFEKGQLPFPAKTLPLPQRGSHLKVGNPAGWLGFPAIAREKLCFFSGTISNWTEAENTYLVDGVAISGVSGGPAFHIFGDTPILIGVVSAYMPNVSSGETLPGLSVVRDVAQFHELGEQYRSLEQAKHEESPPVPPAPSASIPPPPPISAA